MSEKYKENSERTKDLVEELSIPRQIRMLEGYAVMDDFHSIGSSLPSAEGWLEKKASIEYKNKVEADKYLTREFQKGKQDRN